MSGCCQQTNSECEQFPHCAVCKQCGTCNAWSDAQLANPLFLFFAAVRVQQHKEIKVDVEETSWSSRKLYARVSISAPVETVWASLTDYDHLADIVPSLVENKCLERRKNGAVLRQVQAMLLCHRNACCSLGAGLRSKANAHGQAPQRCRRLAPKTLHWG